MIKFPFNNTSSNKRSLAPTSIRGKGKLASLSASVSFSKSPQTVILNSSSPLTNPRSNTYIEKTCATKPVGAPKDQCSAHMSADPMATANRTESSHTLSATIENRDSSEGLLSADSVGCSVNIGALANKFEVFDYPQYSGDLIVDTQELASISRGQREHNVYCAFKNSLSGSALQSSVDLEALCKDLKIMEKAAPPSARKSVALSSSVHRIVTAGTSWSAKTLEHFTRVLKFSKSSSSDRNLPSLNSLVTELKNDNSRDKNCIELFKIVLHKFQDPCFHAAYDDMLQLRSDSSIDVSSITSECSLQPTETDVAKITMQNATRMNENDLIHLLGKTERLSRALKKASETSSQVKSDSPSVRLAAHDQYRSFKDEIQALQKKVLKNTELKMVMYSAKYAKFKMGAFKDRQLGKAFESPKKQIYKAVLKDLFDVIHKQENNMPLLSEMFRSSDLCNTGMRDGFEALYNRIFQMSQNMESEMGVDLTVSEDNGVSSSFSSMFHGLSESVDYLDSIQHKPLDLFAVAELLSQLEIAKTCLNPVLEHTVRENASKTGSSE